MLRQINFKTPRLLLADAYTIGSGGRFESPEAQKYSVYSISFRKNITEIPPFDEKDNRIIFIGLQEIIDDILRDPITHEEIDQSILFLKNRKASTLGLRDFVFDEKMWRRVVDEFNGRLPIVIEALPSGSFVDLQMPVVRVYNTVEGFGPLAAWFESKLLQVWASSLRVTMARYMFDKLLEQATDIETGKIMFDRGITRWNHPMWDQPLHDPNFYTSIRIHDFGDRAAICRQESELLGKMHCYVFHGTDTFSGAYQAFMNGAPSYVGSSVDAQAHRTVGGWDPHYLAYKKLYEISEPGAIISQVADLFDYFTDLKDHLIPLALDSQRYDKKITIVARPDSGDPKEQIRFTLRLMEEHGLFELGKNGFKYPTTMKIIQGDSMTFSSILEIDEMVMREGWAPHAVLLYGVGGYLRNCLTRDTISAKYYLCQVDSNETFKGRQVIKKSNTPGKATLPNGFLTERNTNGQYIMTSDPQVSPYVIYYDGTSPSIYGDGMNEDFNTIAQRISQSIKRSISSHVIVSSVIQEVLK